MAGGRTPTTGKARTVFVDDVTWDRIREMAYRERVTISAVVRRLLEKAVAAS